MVRTYKRKKNRPEIPSSVMRNAIKHVFNRTMSVRRAAFEFNIPKSTLHDRIAKMKKKGQKEIASDSGNDSDSGEELSKYATRQVFTPREEVELEEYMKVSSKMFYGLTYRCARTLAFEYASKINKNYPQTWNEKKMAGVEWMRSFMKRHPRLSYRKPENTSIARATSFNKSNVDHFFKNYAEVQTKYNFTAHRIWNTDETGITTVLQAPKVIAETGTKGVGQCVSAERGVLVTMCGTVSASGNSIPPLYIFPRIRMKESFLYGAVPGSVGFAEKSGWMSSKLFVKLLEHIQKHTSCNQANPILLLMDNHETHATVDAISYARENGIVLLSFPPHCTHRMQPLDKGIYGPFKSRCKASFNDYILGNPGKPISIYDTARLTADPFLQSFTPKNILSSFSSTGIWPINSMIFTDDDFLGSYATDRDIKENFSQNSPAPSFCDTTLVHSQEILTSQENPISADIASTSAASCTQTINNDIDEVTNMIKGLLNDIVDEVTKPKINIISIVEIKPYPKATPRKREGKSRLGKSRIYTSTPEKDRLVELENKRKQKLNNTTTKRKVMLGESRQAKSSTRKACNKKPLLKKSKKKRQRKDDTSSSESEIDLPNNISKKNKFLDSDIDMDSDQEEINYNKPDQLIDNDKIECGDYLLVKFCTKKRILFYIGIVTKECNNQEYSVSYLRKYKNGFHFPQTEDVSIIQRSDIVSKLPKPISAPGTSRTAAILRFDVNFFGYDIQ